MLTPGGGRVGSVLSGSSTTSSPVWPARASAAGSSICTSGRSTRWSRGCPAAATRAACWSRRPSCRPELWERLVAREPVCLVTRLDGDGWWTSQRVRTRTRSPTPARTRRGCSAGRRARPPSRRHGDHRAVAGSQARDHRRRRDRGGADRVRPPCSAGTPRRWSTRTPPPPVLAELAALDNVVVISHDAEIAGPGADGGAGRRGRATSVPSAHAVRSRRAPTGSPIAASPSWTGSTAGRPGHRRRTPRPRSRCRSSPRRSPYGPATALRRTGSIRVMA